MERTKEFPPLAVGYTVLVQNQAGNYPSKWDITGVVVEVRQFYQYGIKIDGSVRIALRNRKFLSCLYYKPSILSLTFPSKLRSAHTLNTDPSNPPTNSSPSESPSEPVHSSPPPVMTETPAEPPEMPESVDPPARESSRVTKKKARQTDREDKVWW